MKQLFILSCCIMLSACIQGEPQISGQAMFVENCAGCHGTDARGGGDLARSLDTVPPDLTGLAARNGGVFPRDYVMSTIDGLTRRPHFSDAMPEFGAGDLGAIIIVENADGTGTPVPERLLALADYLQSLQE